MLFETTMSSLKNSGLVLVLGGFLAGCSDSQPEQVDDSGRPVKLIEIGAGSHESVVRYPAVIGASQESELSFLVSGRVEEVLVKESETVEAGQVLARLETRDFENKVSSAEASFKNADDEFQRAQRLLEQDAIAKSIVDQRMAQRDVTAAQLDTAKKALADSVLTAPFSGIMAKVSVRTTETAAPGNSVMTIIDVSSLEATVNLPASVIAEVPTRENRGVVVILDSVPDTPLEGAFNEANLVGDATSQTYEVSFSFTPPEQLMVLPGMNATVILSSTSALDEPADVSVPLPAVQSDGTGEFVWLVNETNMTVTRRDIQIEPGIGETVSVTSGLAIGDKIVGAGGAYITEGAKVTAWQ